MLHKEGVKMDFDALVNLKHIVSSDNIADVDLMLLKSAINNGNIDINLSISGNLDAILNSDVSNSVFTNYLGEFVGCSDYVLNTPIYRLFLDRKCFCSLLLVAVEKKVVADSIYADIIISLFKQINSARDENLFELALILKDMFSVKHHVDYSLFNDVSVIVEYICNNNYCLSCNTEDMPKLVVKELIMKIFSYGYVHFSDLFNYLNDFMFVRMLVYALFDNNEYAYLLSLINNRMLDRESASALKTIVIEYSSTSDVKNNLIDSILTKLDNIVQDCYKPLM